MQHHIRPRLFEVIIIALPDCSFGPVRMENKDGVRDVPRPDAASQARKQDDAPLASHFCCGTSLTAQP